MDEKQYKELVEKLGAEAAAKIKAEFDSMKAGLITQEKVNEAIEGKLKELKLDAGSIQIDGKTLTEMLKAHGEAIEAAKDNPAQTAHKTIAEQFAQAVEKNKTEWESAVKGKKGMFVFETKNAATMTRGTVPTAANNFVPSQQLIPGYTPYKTNDPILLQVANVVRTQSGVINWVDETAGEGDADWTAEGTAKPLMDVNVTVRNTTVQKVAVFSKVTEEAINDIPFLGSLIEGRQRNKLALKVDTGLLSGDGTGNNITGLTYYAPGYTNTEMNDTVEDPNYFDALAAAATQIRRANFTPNLVFINPVDWFVMMHTKDRDKAYVLLQLQMADGNFLEMRAVQSNQVTAGTFIMGDFRYFNVGIREEVRTEMGWEGTDFKDNTVSMRTEMRLCAWVSENEKLAFCVDQYTDVMTAIEKIVQP